MNTKSTSKKVFSKAKFPIDPLIKRHKSQESYTDLKTLNQEKSSKTFKSTKINQIVSPKTLNYPKATETRIIKDDCVRVLDTEDNISPDHTNRDRDIDDDCDIDELEEMRSSQVNMNFYTNSIGEASQSFLAVNTGIINNLPQPFVKQDKTKIVAEKSDTLYRKLLVLAKKGDRDGFLEVLSNIYKQEGQKTKINFCDESGWTALHYACDEGNLKIVEILIKMNIDINVKTVNKKTPLHLACEKGYFDISRVLIENGAILTVLDDEKNNCIHLTSQRGHYELLKYLLEKLPQADLKNIYGKTPFDLAKNDKVKQLLNEYLGKKNHHFHKITIHNAPTKFANELILNKNKLQDKFLEGYYGDDNKERKLTHTTSKKLTSVYSAKSTTTGSQFSNKLKEKTQSNKKIPLLKTNTDFIISSSSEYMSNNTSDDNLSQDEEKITPGNFICHALLGKGSFGEVYLVERKNIKQLFAMKVLSKDKIMAQNLVKYAMTERNVLSITNHPFIVKLNYAFQSTDRLFLILEYCPGGDLAEHLMKEKKFPEERAKIYLCEIVLALEDLHKRDIIFRDLKPDNVVLDAEGHALLTDFGLSKEGVLDNKGAKSFCGSIAYLAPEMLKRTGHGKSVDWYLLGVLFYEMLVGVPPYFTNNKYRVFKIRDTLFKNITSSELQYPKHISSEAVSLLKGVICILYLAIA
jgi:hypothetical protein